MLNLLIASAFDTLGFKFVSCPSDVIHSLSLMFHLTLSGVCECGSSRLSSSHSSLLSSSSASSSLSSTLSLHTLLLNAHSQFDTSFVSVVHLPVYSSFPTLGMMLFALITTTSHTILHGLPRMRFTTAVSTSDLLGWVAFLIIDTLPARNNYCLLCAPLIDSSIKIFFSDHYALDSFIFWFQHCRFQDSPHHLHLNWVCEQSAHLQDKI